jgi:serine/threonine-protein kinase
MVTMTATPSTVIRSARDSADSARARAYQSAVVRIEQRPKLESIPSFFGRDSTHRSHFEAYGPHRAWKRSGWCVERNPLWQTANCLVYRGVRVADGRPTAIKVESLASQDERQRAQCEYRALNAIRHPNVVRPMGAGTLGPFAWMAMEYMDVADLRWVVQNCGPLEFSKAAEYTRHAALGLAAIHRTGYIHRDIKPGNLMLNRNGVIKIVDFGLAMRTTDPRPNRPTFVGTPQYAATEQIIDSSQVDHRADLFGLGGVLYHLLTGQPPYSAGSVADLEGGGRLRPTVPLLQLRPGTPRALRDLVDWLLSPNPDFRPRSARDVAQALYDFLTT